MGNCSSTSSTDGGSQYDQVQAYYKSKGLQSEPQDVQRMIDSYDPANSGPGYDAMWKQLESQHGPREVAAAGAAAAGNGMIPADGSGAAQANYISGYNVVGNTKDPKGILVMVHGLGDTRDPEWVKLCEEHYAREMPHLACILPKAQEKQATVYDGKVMPAWFDIRAVGTDVEDVQGVHGSSDEVLEKVNQFVVEQGWKGTADPPLPTVFAGFSQGALLSLTAALKNNSSPAPASRAIDVKGVASMGGFIGAETATLGLNQQSQVSPFRLGVFHGKADTVVPTSMVWGATKRLKETPATANSVAVGPFEEYPGLEHDTSEKMMKQDVLQFLKETLPAAHTGHTHWSAAQDNTTTTTSNNTSVVHTSNSNSNNSNNASVITTTTAAAPQSPPVTRGMAMTEPLHTVTTTTTNNTVNNASLHGQLSTIPVYSNSGQFQHQQTTRGDFDAGNGLMASTTTTSVMAPAPTTIVQHSHQQLNQSPQQQQFIVTTQPNQQPVSVVAGGVPTARSVTPIAGGYAVHPTPAQVATMTIGGGAPAAVAPPTVVDNFTAPVKPFIMQQQPQQQQQQQQYHQYQQQPVKQDVLVSPSAPAPLPVAATAPAPVPAPLGQDLTLSSSVGSAHGGRSMVVLTSPPVNQPLSAAADRSVVLQQEPHHHNPQYTATVADEVHRQMPNKHLLHDTYGHTTMRPQPTVIAGPPQWNNNNAVPHIVRQHGPSLITSENKAIDATYTKLSLDEHRAKQREATIAFGSVHGVNMGNDGKGYVVKTDHYGAAVEAAPAAAADDNVSEVGSTVSRRSTRTLSGKQVLESMLGGTHGQSPSKKRRGAAYTTPKRSYHQESNVNSAVHQLANAYASPSDEKNPFAALNKPRAGSGMRMSHFNSQGPSIIREELDKEDSVIAARTLDDHRDSARTETKWFERTKYTMDDFGR